MTYLEHRIHFKSRRNISKNTAQGQYAGSVIQFKTYQFTTVGLRDPEQYHHHETVLGKVILASYSKHT